MLTNLRLFIKRRVPALLLAAALVTGLAGCSGSSESGSDSAARLGVNIILVAMDDYQGEGDPNLAAMVNRFIYMMGLAGITIEDITYYTYNGADADRLTFVDLSAGDMEELLPVSSGADKNYLNFFIVKLIDGFGILGLAPYVNGPAVNGTTASGVLVSTFGGLSLMSDSDKQMQGDTMAHEGGHFLGLWHTTEDSGDRFDPLADTPECPASSFDANSDGRVTSGECQEQDGPNFMFWSAASYLQEVISEMQTAVMKAHDLVTN